MHTISIKYKAIVYFQTKKYKGKLTTKFQINLFLFISNNFHDKSKLYYDINSLDINSPKRIKKHKRIIGIPIIFQQKQEILL